MVKKLFSFASEGGKGTVFLLCFFATFPEKGILDFIAHRPIIQGFTVSRLGCRVIIHGIV